MLWHGRCADFEKTGPCGQLQFAQAQRSWYGGRERGDWTQQLDLTNTESGQRRPTSDAARSCFGDWEKMLSDSERASSIMAPVRLSAGWLWEKRESEKREREGEAQESTRKAIERETGEREKERGEDKENIAWLAATGPLNRCTPPLHPAILQPHLSTPSSHQEPIFSSTTPTSSLSMATSLHSVLLWNLLSLSLSPSVQWSLRPSIPPSWTAECEADRPWSERGSCQRPAAEPSLTGH